MLLTCPRADHDNRQIGQPFIMAHLAGNFEAVHPGHFNVQQHHIRTPLLKQRDGFDAVFGNHHVHPLPLEQAGSHFAHRDRVIHTSTIRMLARGDTGVSGTEMTQLVGDEAIARTIDESTIRAAQRKAAVARTSGAPMQIDEYVVERELGRGAQSIVYLVRSQKLAGRYFVLKRPHLASTQMAAVSESLVRELARLAQIYHPNVINVVGRGTFDGLPYLVTDYLIGATVRGYFRPPVAPDHPALISLVRDVSAALGRLERQGLVHRDIKPDNLFVQLDLDPGARFNRTEHGSMLPLKTVLLDFGITVVESAEVDAMISGTPGFLPPEQFRGRRHPRSDVWSFAAVLHWILTGRTFFSELVRNGTLAELALETVSRPPPMDLLAERGVPSGVIDLLQSASSLDPDERPSASEIGRRYIAAVDG